MKIVLAALNASYVHTNLAVRCIAAALCDAGHTAVIFERSLKDRSRELLHALYLEDADVYGFSVYIWNREAVLSLAADLHTLCPQAKIVLGGPEISFEGEEFFTLHPYIDNIISGEGEAAFVRFCAGFPARHTIICGEAYTGFCGAGILYDRYPPDGHTAVFCITNPRAAVPTHAVTVSHPLRMVCVPKQRSRRWRTCPALKPWTVSV